jgi:hypothetical protein
MIGSSIAGTLDYGAPEQMGRRKEPVGAYSDVYGWAKTCCYALFQTTQPLLKHWSSLPRSLAELLEKCLDEDPQQRPRGFVEVLKGLDTEVAPAAPAPIVPQQDAPGARTTRKKPKKNLLPRVLGGVGVLAVALIVVFGFVLVGAKKEGPRLAECGNTAAPDQGEGKRASGQEDEQQPKDKPKEKAGNTPPPAAAGKSSDKDEPKKDGPPAKLDSQTKDEYSVGKGSLVITTTVVDDRRVRFVFVARNCGNDVSPLTDWINTNQGYYRRKLVS